jgi:protein-S-isoprenylcysteine O-methyltransferase Ste14
MGLLIFVPAGSLSFRPGWAYWILFSVGVSAITLYFLRYDPHLIEGRVAAGPRAEARTRQKIIQTVAALLFFAVLIVPGLDYRFHWSHLHAAVALVGDALLVLSLVMIFFVFRENSFAAGTIRVEAGQRVISTGPYQLVRHPLYLAGLILFVATPIALVSAWGLLLAPPFLAVLIARLRDEERYLCAYLSGYDQYCQRVRYRLVPLVW